MGPCVPGPAGPARRGHAGDRPRLRHLRGRGRAAPLGQEARPLVREPRERAPGHRRPRHHEVRGLLRGRDPARGARLPLRDLDEPAPREPRLRLRGLPRRAADGAAARGRGGGLLRRSSSSPSPLPSTATRSSTRRTRPSPRCTRSRWPPSSPATTGRGCAGSVCSAPAPSWASLRRCGWGASSSTASPSPSGSAPSSCARGKAGGRAGPPGGTCCACSARGPGAVAVGWTAMVAFWPWAMLDPLRNPFRAADRFSRFWEDMLLFYDGRLLPAVAVSRFYLPNWFALTTPELYLVAAALSLVALALRWRAATPGPRRPAAAPAGRLARRHPVGPRRGGGPEPHAPLRRPAPLPVPLPAPRRARRGRGRRLPPLAARALRPAGRDGRPLPRLRRDPRRHGAAPPLRVGLLQPPVGGRHEGGRRALRGGLLLPLLQGGLGVAPAALRRGALPRAHPGRGLLGPPADGALPRRRPRRDRGSSRPSPSRGSPTS